MDAAELPLALFLVIGPEAVTASAEYVLYVRGVLLFCVWLFLLRCELASRSHGSLGDGGCGSKKFLSFENHLAY